LEISTDFLYLDDFFPDDNGLCILSKLGVSFALQKKITSGNNILMFFYESSPIGIWFFISNVGQTLEISVDLTN